MSLFGATTSQPQTSSVFGSVGNNNQQAGGLFGATSQPQQTSQPEQRGSLFGGTLGQSQQSQPQQSGGLFGSLGASSNQQTQGQNQQQPSGGLFASNFGQTQQTREQQEQQQRQQQEQQRQQKQGSLLGQSQHSLRLFQQPDLSSSKCLGICASSFTDRGFKLGPRSVADQMELAFARWDPLNPISQFQTYLYNHVDPSQAPFYGPRPNEDEIKWEEALRKKPSPGSVPVLVKGFKDIGQRMIIQTSALTLLQGRLHEINDGLTNLLQKHDLEISTRATECRRRHVRLSHQCLRLASKVQVLRNRGYAMDSAEEDLRKKLLALEKTVFDPELNGRAEEIWARMVSIRERGRLLQREFEKSGRSLPAEPRKGMDEETVKKAKKASLPPFLRVRSLANDRVDIGGL